MPEFNAAQQERKLSRRLFVALATPLTILLAMATVLGLQLSRLNRDARWVDHSDEVVAKLLDVQRQIQSRTDRAARSEGLGLGLYIVHQLLLAHGGTIEVSSSEAAGTTFRIQLPREPPPAT